MTEENSTEAVVQPELSNLLTPERILVFSGRQEKTEVLNHLIDVLAETPEIGSRDDLAWGIFHRESLMSTGIGNGIATPHFRLQDIEECFMALAVCPDGVCDYETVDSQPVKLVFMIVNGKNQKTFHVRVLSVIGKLFSDGRLKAALLAASDANTCYEIITRAEK